MKVKYDREADAMYIYLSSKLYAYGKDLDDERRIDYASDNTPMGVELLCTSKGVNLEGLPNADKIAEAIENKGIKTYRMEMKRPDFIISGKSGIVLIEVKFASSARIDRERHSARISEEVTACR
ncbi:MAG: DUF2283 domain-containing protein [Dehalococcoidia bacterium]